MKKVSDKRIILEQKIIRRLEEEKPKHSFLITAYEVLMVEFDGVPGAEEIINKLMDAEG